jgi:biotin carboxyl carrier protein
MKMLPGNAHETADFISHQKGSPAFKHPIKVPIGIQDKTIHYTTLPNQTPLTELQKHIVAERQKAGLSSYPNRNERDQLLFHTAWQKGSEIFIRSTMSARVTSIYVTPGQYVRGGERIAVIEAMKMENTILSSHAGMVQNISCALGDTIGVDTVIASIVQWENIQLSDIIQNKDVLISLFPSSEDDSPGSPPPTFIASPIALKPSTKFIPHEFESPELPVVSSLLATIPFVLISELTLRGNASKVMKLHKPIQKSRTTQPYKRPLQSQVLANKWEKIRLNPNIRISLEYEKVNITEEALFINKYSPPNIIFHGFQWAFALICLVQLLYIMKTLGQDEYLILCGLRIIQK